jgi:hypothetical protein
VDSMWSGVADAVRAGRLGDAANVSTARPNPNAQDPAMHVICVYTYDADEEVDVRRVRAELRTLGLNRPISYKMNRATYEGRYRARGYRRISRYYE